MGSPDYSSQEMQACVLDFRPRWFLNELPIGKLRAALDQSIYGARVTGAEMEVDAERHLKRELNASKQGCENVKFFLMRMSRVLGPGYILITVVL